MIKDDASLREAKRYVKELFDEGCNCPCCGQFVRRYRRNLNSGMARFLINLYRLDKQRPAPYHARDILTGPTQGGDYCILQHWGLIKRDESPNENPNTKTSGYWFITHRGRHFVEGKESITKYCLYFNAKCLGFDGPQVTILDCLGKKFNYQELMGNYVYNSVFKNMRFKG